MPDNGFFAKTGKDSINIAGHKIPIALLGGIAALGGVLLIIRARQSGSNVVSAGNQAQLPSITNTSPDYSGALANISAQLTNLSQNGVNSAPGAVPTPTPVPAVVAGPTTPPTPAPAPAPTPPAPPAPWSGLLKILGGQNWLDYNTLGIVGSTNMPGSAGAIVHSSMHKTVNGVTYYEIDKSNGVLGDWALASGSVQLLP